MAVRLLALFLIACLGGCATPTGAPAPADRLWSGEAVADGETTRVVIRLTGDATAPAADMTLPDIGVSGWPAAEVVETAQGLTLVFPSDAGPQTMRLDRRDGGLAGTWSEPGRPDARLSLRAGADADGPREQRLVVDGPAGPLGVSVFTPPGRGPFPGLVMLHGSGPEPRDANRFAAQALARQGVVVAIFDKRGVAESGGDLAGAGFPDLAADAIAVADALAERSDVGRIGFFGHSQGGWVAPLAASLWPDAAFVVTSAGPAVPPSREAQWDVVRALRALGAGAGAEDRARAAIALWHDGVRTGDWAPFDRAMAGLADEPWVSASGLDAFADHPDADFQRAYRAFMDFDPLPVLRRLDVPLLAILAPDDASIDSVETATILEGLVREGRDIRVRLYPGYDHALRRLGPDGAPLRWPAQPPDYYAVQADFIRTAAAGGR